MEATLSCFQLPTEGVELANRNALSICLSYDPSWSSSPSANKLRRQPNSSARPAGAKLGQTVPQIPHGRSVRADSAILVNNDIRAVEPQPLVRLTEGRVVESVVPVPGEKEGADTKVFAIRLEINKGTKQALSQCLSSPDPWMYIRCSFLVRDLVRLIHADLDD